MSEDQLASALSIKAIAQRLYLGSSKSANIRLHAAMAQATPAEPFQPTLGL